MHEEFERAFAEFQWMHRSGVSFEEQDLSNLASAADQSGSHQEHSHRLLGCGLPQTGNHGMSARHYQMSLAQYRDGAEKEA